MFNCFGLLWKQLQNTSKYTLSKCLKRSWRSFSEIIYYIDQECDADRSYLCFRAFHEAKLLLTIMRRVWLLTNDIFHIFLGMCTSISLFITFQIFSPATVTPGNCMLYICKSPRSKVCLSFIWLKYIDFIQGTWLCVFGVLHTLFPVDRVMVSDLSHGQPQIISQVQFLQ